MVRIATVGKGAAVRAEMSTGVNLKRRNLKRINPMSSKRHIRRKKCERKKQYADRAAAVSAGIRLVKMGGDWLRAYRCSFCSLWHLGHTPARIERAAANGIARSRVLQKLNRVKAG